MSKIFSGSTPKYLLKIKDEQGLQLDPTNASQIVDVKIYIYNALTGADVAKFYLNANPGAGWTALGTQNLGGGDVRVKMILTAAMTAAITAGGSNVIQVNAHVYDTDYPNNSRIVIQKGKFHEIDPAHS